MSTDWIFEQIKNVVISEEAIKQFINNVVYKHANSSVLLKNFSYIYVLVASYNEQKLLRDGEKTWKEIMKKNEYDIFKKNTYFVVSYMLVKEKDQNNHYIELFDTIIRNNNLGRVMITKYETRYEVNLVPQEIIPSSAEYWAKVLHLYYYDCNTGKKGIDKEVIEEYIKEFELNSNDLSWKHLYELCDNDDEPIKSLN